MATDVLFNQIPGNLLAPFFFAEINSGGTPFEGQPRLLMVGQKTAGGVASAGVPYGPIQSPAEADAQFGVGSMLAYMFRVARNNAPFQPVWALPLADPAGVAAAGAITFVAPGVTGAGILHVLGRDCVFQVNAADSASNVATNAAAAINALNLPITAVVDGTTPAKVDVTIKHVGAVGNGQEFIIATDVPNVFTATNTTIVALSGGSGVPVLTTALANLGDQEYDFIAAPYADASSLNAIRDYLNDSVGRWSPMQQLYGGYFTANFGTLSANVTLGVTRNDQHSTIMSSQVSPVPQWEWAAAYAAMACAHLSDAPEVSRPLQTLVLNGILPPRDRSLWWDIADRQALYSSGMAAYKVTVDGEVTIDRAVTTYRLNSAGVPDATFRDTETMFQSMFAVRFLRTAVSNRHSRQALADDNPFNLAEVTTTKDIRNTLVHAYSDLVALGIAENAELFAQYLVVTRDPNNATRVNVYFPIDLVNQLRVFAVNVTAFLQYQTPSGASAVN